VDKEVGGANSPEHMSQEFDVVESAVRSVASAPGSRPLVQFANVPNGVLAFRLENPRMLSAARASMRTLGSPKTVPDHRRCGGPVGRTHA
jgi:hypothetical protein